LNTNRCFLEGATHEIPKECQTPIGISSRNRTKSNPTFSEK